MVNFIAEFTTNHLGNLNLLLEMVRAASKSGADYIKMQKKDVDNFYSKEKLESPYDSPYGKTYYDYRKIFEFDKRSFDIFNEECKMFNIPWFSTAQDIKSLEFLLQYDLPMYKIASCNASNNEMLYEVKNQVSKDKTIVISVAGLTLKQIKDVVDIFPDHNLLINHCVAEYPCKLENLRLGNIAILKKEFSCDRIAIGYSGHEEGLFGSLLAALIGVECIERHFCMSRHSIAHHIECSLEPNEFGKLVTLVNNAEKNGYPEVDLNDIMFKVDFGMSDMEKSFLIDKTYGCYYLGKKSNHKQ